MKNSIVLLILSFLLSVSSCTSMDNNIVASIEFANEDDLNPVITSRGGSMRIGFKSSKSWAAILQNSSDSEWCCLSTDKGGPGDCLILLEISPNEGYNDRIALINIVSDDVVRVVTLTQKQKDAITFARSIYNIDSNGGIISIEIGSNIDYEYKISDEAKEWIKESESKSMSFRMNSFFVAENHSIQDRDGSIEFFNSDIKENILIRQKGSAPFLSVSQNEYIIPCTGKTLEILYNSNVDISCRVQQDCDWVIQETSSEVQKDIFIFTVLESDEISERSTSIDLFNEEYNLSVLLRIKQEQRNVLSVDEDSYVVSAAGSVIDMVVYSNIKYSTHLSDDWITDLTYDDSFDFKRFQISYNNQYNERKGSIEFISLDEKLHVIVSITQLGNTGSLVDPTEDYEINW